MVHLSMAFQSDDEHISNTQFLYTASELVETHTEMHTCSLSVGSRHIQHCAGDIIGFHTGTHICNSPLIADVRFAC